MQNEISKIQKKSYLCLLIPIVLILSFHNIHLPFASHKYVGCYALV